MSRVGAVLLAAVLPLGLLAGCSHDAAAKPHARRTTPAPSAPAPSPPPAAGSCYQLDYASALQPTSDARPVSCRGPHTTETVYVGTLQPLLDGHLLDATSTRLQRQVSRVCTRQLAVHLGGGQDRLHQSRFAVVWFSPAVAQRDRGALWYRCDLLALAGHQRLAPLPARTRGLLAGPKALDRFGTCGTAAPGQAGFQRIICSQPHRWRVRSTLALTGPYLGKAERARADAACRDVVSRIAHDPLKLRWSFEWPSRQQWDRGQHWGSCWTPDPA